MSHVFAGYHIVFATKGRKRTLPKPVCRKLYNYIYGIIKNYDCLVFRINGMEDHLHIAIDLNPSVALATLVRDLKRSSSLKLNEDEDFPEFEGWGKGYYACTFSPDVRQSVINYIMNQEKHHSEKDLNTELAWLSLKAGLKYFDNDYM